MHVCMYVVGVVGWGEGGSFCVKQRPAPLLLLLQLRLVRSSSHVR